MSIFKKATTPDQLFKQQQAISRASGIVSGAAALGGQFSGMINSAKNINTTAPTAMVDSFGKPMYNIGNFQSQVSAIKPQSATGGEVLSGAMQGASAGSQFGFIGAGIGAVAGAIGTLFAGKRRKTLQQRRKSLAQSNLRDAQRMYNQGIEAFNMRQSAMSQYGQQQDLVDQRMNNVYEALS